MSLYNEKKIGNLQKAKGKYVGASAKLNNYEYGRNKARTVAISKAKNERKA